ncbi:transcription factor PAP1-domain-containing protein [Paraphoma chrysanthemicola]|nr:transcription factor PAP1-domain-containing protein [Paraphoma chrysanthemicola]
MCYQVVQRYSVCRCLYYKSAIVSCAAKAQSGHSVIQKTVLVDFACSVHSNDHAKQQSGEQTHAEDMLEHEQQHAPTTRSSLDISVEARNMTAKTFDSLWAIQQERLVAETDTMLNCHAIWDKLANRADFKDGTIDIDNLCSELRAKARCSDSGVVVDHRDVEEALRKLREPQKSTNDGIAGAVGMTDFQGKRGRRPKRGPRHKASARVQKRQSSWRRLALASDSSEGDLTASDSQAPSFKDANGRSNRGYREMSHGAIQQPRRSNMMVGKVKYTVSEDTTKDDDTRCRALFQALGCRVAVRAVCRFGA